MARPIKEGLDYFPFDVDFAVNAKTEAIMGEYGAKGVLLMIYLLSAVYQNGYFLRWDKLKQMQLANRVEGSSPELVNQIVDRLIDYGTFDKELFNSAKVLTSQRIQATYLDATKRRKQVKPTLYWINDDNNHRSSVVNVNINPQSKGKESKGKESKTPQTTGGGLPNLVDLYQENLGTANPLTIEDIGYELEDWQKINADQAFDIIKLAMKIASDNQKHSWAYVKGILKRWRENDGTDLGKIKALNTGQNQEPAVKGGSYDGVEF